MPAAVPGSEGELQGSSFQITAPPLCRLQCDCKVHSDRWITFSTNASAKASCVKLPANFTTSPVLQCHAMAAWYCAEVIIDYESWSLCCRERQLRLSKGQESC